MLHKLNAYFLLCRIWNALFAAGVCVYSFFIAKNNFDLNYSDVVLLSLGIFFLVAFANAHNDIIDFEVDKINRPKRPLPSGKINLKTAYIATLAWLLLAVFFGFAANLKFAILFLAIGLLSFVYNKFLKGLPLIGNFTVALLTTTPIIVPVIKLGFPQPELLNLVFFAFILTFAREILKDIEDIAGDSLRNLKTFPIIFGANYSLAIAFICELLCLIQIVIFKPFLLIGVALPIIFSVIFAISKKWRYSQSALKFAMLAGLVFLGIAHC